MNSDRNNDEISMSYKKYRVTSVTIQIKLINNSTAIFKKLKI
jgi:hypothetical protein